MNTTSIRRPLWLLCSFLLLSFSSLSWAEPPSRAARLAHIAGTVSFSPAGQPDWVRAAINRPLTTGDRLWTDGDSRAELQIGGAAIRMGPSTSMVLLNLDDRIAQVQLTQGTVKVRVRSLGPRQTFEIATPNLAFTLRRAGDYRIEVDPNDDATAVMVLNGEAEVYGEGASYAVDSRRAYRFYGTDLSDYDVLTARGDDDLDRWSRERDRRGDGSVSARYVSPEVVGYEDLDDNGSWRVDATYGNVWIPRRVAAGWTPYRDGHWSWVDPWGWTWVDDAPWGYAVSHYGRWAHVSGTWAWVPGPRRERAVYAPALVAFVGGSNFQVTVSAGSAPASNVGWFPLAPREVYQPSYPVSRVYFDNINRSNAVIAPTTITNIYNTTIVKNTTNINNVVYANQTVTNAVVAVPTQAFVRSQPVARAAVQLPHEALVSAPVVRVASVAPVQQSVQGGAPEATTRPPARQKEMAIVARTAPPPAPLPFAIQQQQLAARPGTPIDEAQRTQLKPAAPAAAAPKVSVVAAAPAPTATALPPATPPAAKSPEARKAAAAKADTAGGEIRKPDEDKADAAKAASAKGEAVKAEESKAAAAQAEASRTAAAKADAAKAAETKATEAKADANKAASAKAEAGKAEEAKADKAQRDAAKAEASKAEALKAEAARAETAQAATAKAEAAKVDAARAEASKAAAAKAAAETADASKAAAAKSEAAKTAEAKADAGKAASARSEARAEKAQRDAAKAEASKAEAARADAGKAETARAEAAKVALARAETAKADAARADAAKADAARAEAAKAAAKAEAAKAEAARTAMAKAPAAAPPPKARASGPKSDADAADDDKKKDSRKP